MRMTIERVFDLQKGFLQHKRRVSQASSVYLINFVEIEHAV